MEHYASNTNTGRFKGGLPQFLPRRYSLVLLLLFLSGKRGESIPEKCEFDLRELFSKFRFEAG